MIQIVGRKKIWFALSIVLVGAAVAAMLVFGFREGIDFKGGSLWQFSVSSGAPALGDLNQALQQDFGYKDARATYDAAHGEYFVRLPALSEPQHAELLAKAQAKYPSLQELGFSSIGPSVGASLRNNAIVGLLLVLVGISLYIAFAFRKASYPVSSWKYGWVTLLTLFHDVSIPAGLFAVLGHFSGAEIDTNFVVALLVVMGFSVHDTIVVFDRVRENLMLKSGRGGFDEIVNESVNQTLARSVNTSLTLVLVLLALYFVGPQSLQYFVLTLLVGVVTGVYSSIFIASPLLTVVRGKK